jgi:hypothetical protein
MRLRVMGRHLPFSPHAAALTKTHDRLLVSAKASMIAARFTDKCSEYLLRSCYGSQQPNYERRRCDCKKDPLRPISARRCWGRIVSGAVRRFFPRIDNAHSCFVEVVSISGHNGKAVVKGGRGDHQVGLRIGMTDFSAFFHQHAPPEKDIFGDRQNPFMEHGPYVCVSQRLNSSRRSPASSRSMPNRSCRPALKS